MFIMDNPVGIWCNNDVVLTSMRRDYVASTLIRRHFGTKCPLGSIYRGTPIEFGTVRQMILEIKLSLTDSFLSFNVYPGYKNKCVFLFFLRWATSQGTIQKHNNDTASLG